MQTVRQLLDSKGPEVWTIKPDDSVFSAIQLMAEKHVGSLLVMRGEKLVGILSERDYARKVILKNKASKTTPVKDIMTKRVIYVGPHQTIDSCMRLMTNKMIRHLPVLKDEKVIGIISIGDAVRSLLSEREHRIQQLENYITAG